MDAHDIEQEHHEPHGPGGHHGHGGRDQAHERDEQRGETAAEAPGEQDHHVFRAAAAGRAEVVGAAGMGLLQRTAGNAAIGAMVQRSRAGAAEPAAEQAEQAEHTEQAEQAGQAEEQRSPVHDVVSSGGSPLDTDTRTDMERRMGADFSDVRVHHDSAAHESAKGVGAHAYTVGNNVVFQRDAYDPGSPQGRTTLAHELTHVIQQRNGPVEGTEAPGGIRVSDPSDRFEREAVANADRVLSDPAPEAAPAPAPAAPVSAPAPSAASAASAASAVQRAATEDEDEQPADVQGSFVQRAAEKKPGEEEEEETPPA
ncbi:eCIS core domain-containing protein [Streptomyces sp. DH18]|uniref:eCIS core domain-containing protein n=1 Tax=Streptomyces sp. DH18 TaxID=3040126 RepID=UPI003FA7B7E0